MSPPKSLNVFSEILNFEMKKRSKDLIKLVKKYRKFPNYFC